MKKIIKAVGTDIISAAVAYGTLGMGNIILTIASGFETAITMNTGMLRRTDGNNVESRSNRIDFNDDDIRAKFLEDGLNDNRDTKFVRALLRIIYNHEKDIIKSNKELDNPLGLSKKGIHSILNPLFKSNIPKVLGISYDTVKEWFSKLEKQKPIVFNDKSFFAVYHGLVTNFALRSFSKVQLELQSEIDSHYENVISQGWKYFRASVTKIFNKYTKETLGYNDISLKIFFRRSEGYIQQFNKFQFNGDREDANKYFQFLTDLYLTDFSSHLSERNDIHKVRKECYNLFVKIFKDRNDIVSFQTYETFRITFLFNLGATLIKRYSDPQSYTYFRLELEEISKGIRVSELFNSHMPYSKSQLRNIIDYFKSNGYNSPLISDVIIPKLELYYKSAPERKSSYSQGFIQTKPLQIGELFGITLGLDVISGEFIKDGSEFMISPELNPEKYAEQLERVEREGIKVMDVIRSHNYHGRSYSLIFERDSEAQSGFRFRLIPVSDQSHGIFHNLRGRGLSFKRRIYDERMRHLFELVTALYENSITKDYIKKELENREFEEEFLWDRDFDFYMIAEGFIKNLKVLKDKGLNGFLEEKFPLFFNELYKPQYDMMIDLSSTSKIREWYLTNYLPENIDSLPPHLRRAYIDLNRDLYFLYLLK